MPRDAPNCKTEANYANPMRPPYLPSRSVAWDRLLAGSPAAGRVRIHVSHRWDQVTLERMVEPGGYWRILWATGLITEYGPKSTGPLPLRTIYMTDDQARALHAWAPLIQVWWESSYAWFRFAEAGEAPSAVLRMPTGG